MKNKGNKLYYKYKRKGSSKTLFFDLNKGLKNLKTEEYFSFIRTALDNNDIYIIETFIDKDSFRNFLKKESAYITSDGLFAKIKNGKLISEEDLKEIIQNLVNLKTKDNLSYFNLETWNNFNDYNLFIEYVINGNFLEFDSYINEIDVFILKKYILTNPNDEKSIYIRKRKDLMQEILRINVNRVNQESFIEDIKLNLLKIVDENTCTIPSNVLCYYHDYRIGNRPKEFSADAWSSLSPYFEMFSENFEYKSTIEALNKALKEKNINLQLEYSFYSYAYLYSRGKAFENSDILEKVLEILKKLCRKRFIDDNQIIYCGEEEILLFEFLKDKNLIEQISEVFPEVILFVKCDIDENIIMNCINKIENTLISTLEYRINNDSNYMSHMTIFSNEIIMNYLINRNPEFFNFALFPVSENKDIYNIAVQKGFIINPIIATEDIYKAKEVIDNFLELHSDKKEIIERMSKKIGISNLMHLKNDILLHEDTINILGFDNVCKIIKYIEVPNCIPNMKELFMQYGIETIYFVYKYLNIANYAKNIEEFDIKLFIKLLNKLDKYKTIFQEINVYEYLKKYPIAMYKLLMSDNFEIESLKDIVNYNVITSNKLYDAIKNQDTLTQSNIILELFGIDIYEIDRIYNKYSSVYSKSSQIYANSSTSFKMIAEELQKKNIRNDELDRKREYYISIARMLDDNLEMLNAIVFELEPYLSNISESILYLLQNNDANIIRYISAIINFDRKAKELYSYDYESSFTLVEDITKTAEKDGVIIRELLGEPYCLPLHTRDFAQKSNTSIDEEKEIGKTYICWTLSSDIHCGHARGSNHTFIYSDIMDNELLLAAPTDIYSTGTSNNSYDINAEYQSRFLPTKYMSKYCLQYFNELVSIRGTKPTALFVEEKEDITPELIIIARQFTTSKTIVVKNENLYYKQHLEKLNKLMDEINISPTSKNVEEFLYLGMSYMFAYGDKKSYVESGNNLIYCGSNEFNYKSIINIFEKIIDDIGKKQIIEGEDKMIIEIISMYIRNCYVLDSKETFNSNFVGHSAIIIKESILKKLQEYESLKYVGQFLDSYVELDLKDAPKI